MFQSQERVQEQVSDWTLMASARRPPMFFTLKTEGGEGRRVKGRDSEKGKREYSRERGIVLFMVGYGKYYLGHSGSIQTKEESDSRYKESGKPKRPHHFCC